MNLSFDRRGGRSIRSRRAEVDGGLLTFIVLGIVVVVAYVIALSEPPTEVTIQFAVPVWVTLTLFLVAVLVICAGVGSKMGGISFEL